MGGEEKRGEERRREEKRGDGRRREELNRHVVFISDSYIGFAINSYVVKSNYPKTSCIQHEIVVILLFAIMSSRRLKIWHCLLSLEKGT